MKTVEPELCMVRAEVEAVFSSSPPEAVNPDRKVPAVLLICTGLPVLPAAWSRVSPLSTLRVWMVEEAVT